MNAPEHRPVIRPGVYPDIPAVAYHRDICPVPSLSAGVAEALVNESPLHAWTRHPRLNPNHTEEHSSKFDIGTAAHALLLEGIDRMEICPFDDWKKGAAREQRDDARARGLIPVLLHQAEEIMLMVEAAKKAFAACEDLAGYSLAEGMAEQTLVWTESSHRNLDLLGAEIWLRCRPDWMPPDRRIIVDAKFTATSANPEAFARQIVSMAYDLRASFYLRGNRETDGAEDAKYLFLVQEIAPPYATAIIGMPPAFIAMGDEKVEAALNLWRQCMATDEWPGYPNRICYAEPPAWAMSQWAERQESAICSGVRNWEFGHQG